MDVLYAHLQHHNDTIIKTQWQRQTHSMTRTQEDFLEKYLPLTLLQGFEKGYSRFACERELETEHNWNILTPNLWPSTLCLSRSQMLKPEVQRPLCWVMAFFTASYQYILRISTHQGPKAPSARCGFPYHISSPTGCNSTALTSVLTELYNSSTPTWSPTRTLKSNV